MKKKIGGDALNPKGRVKIKVYNAEGALVDMQQGDNLVVNGGREACAILTATGDTDKIVQDIAFGSGGTVPDLTDTALVSQDLIKALESTTAYPTQTAVKYIGICETTENNGINVFSKQDGKSPIKMSDTKAHTFGSLVDYLAEENDLIKKSNGGERFEGGGHKQEPKKELTGLAAKMAAITD